MTEGSMKTRFRRANNSPEEWHFEEHCPAWPATGFSDTEEVPPTSQLCPKCVDLKARDLLWHLIGPKGFDVEPARLLELFCGQQVEPWGRKSSSC
jgi:hypothetical protein